MKRKATTVNLCARVAPEIHKAVREACAKTSMSVQDFVVVAVLDRLLQLERKWLDETGKPARPSTSPGV